MLIAEQPLFWCLDLAPYGLDQAPRHTINAAYALWSYWLQNAAMASYARHIQTFLTPFACQIVVLSAKRILTVPRNLLSLGLYAYQIGMGTSSTGNAVLCIAGAGLGVSGT